MPRVLRVATLIPPLFLSGCTVVGLATGATIDANTAPSYEDAPPGKTRPLRKDEPIRVLTTRGSHLEGGYYGVRPPTPADPETYLWLRVSDGSLSRLRYSDVKAIGVRTPKRGWAYGTLTGLAVDVAVVAVLAHTTVGNVKMGEADLRFH